MSVMISTPSPGLKGRCLVPGDKSISHRALMFGALATGITEINGLLEGEDVLATASALRKLGADIRSLGNGQWEVNGYGIGSMVEPDDVLDMGNAGTGARLLLGILAGQSFTSFLTGDASLRRRPMRRVTEPLELMGCEFITREGGLLPMAVCGNSDLLPITYTSKVASAQVKSAVLLAGLHTPGITTVIEPLQSRDHTERMLAAMGANIETELLEGGRWRVSLSGQPDLKALPVLVPADPSSAAFPLVAALLVPNSEVVIEGVGINPQRTGLLATLKEMGAAFELQNVRDVAGETIADIEVASSSLRGVDVPSERSPSMIDEYPVLAVAAAFAEGETRMRGLAELRVKETDRLTATAQNLEACGIAVRVDGDDLIVLGSERPQGGATVDAELDHRIAMSFAVMGLAAKHPVTINGAEAIATSFPDFPKCINDLGGAIDLSK